MASIRKRDKKWQVRWKDLNGRECARTCSSRRIAKELQRDIEDELSMGRNWQPEVAREVPHAQAVTEAFICDQSVYLKPRTLRRYAENLDLFLRFLRDELGEPFVLVNRWSIVMLKDFNRWLQRPENGLHGRQRSGDTARKIVEVLQLTWKWAEGSERWPGEIPPPRTIKMVRARPSQVRAPTWEQMDACVHACTGWQTQVATVLRYTGLRVSTVMLLEWRDINLEQGTLSLRPEVVKEGMGRLIPISRHLCTQIAGWGTREGYLIESGRKRGPRHRMVRARDFARAWDRAGVPAEVRTMPTHAFRKGFKSRMLQDGAHPDAVDFLQGHAFAGGSRGRYIDPWSLNLEATVARIPRIKDNSNSVRLHLIGNG